MVLRARVESNLRLMQVTYLYLWGYLHHAVHSSGPTGSYFNLWFSDSVRNEMNYHTNMFYIPITILV